LAEHSSAANVPTKSKFWEDWKRIAHPVILYIPLPGAENVAEGYVVKSASFVNKERPGDETRRRIGCLAQSDVDVMMSLSAYLV